MNKREVYLDHAATTPVDPRVFEAMSPYFTTISGNPSSFHSSGKSARDAVESARETIARLIHARSDEILFTSGGTESDNLAILGIARAHKSKGNHLITTTTEHPAVLEAMQYLQAKEGFEVTFLEVDREGKVSAELVAKAIKPETILVSVILANNEIGTINPIAEIGQMIAKQKSATGSVFPYFHTDACQAAGALEIDMTKLHVDLLTLNAGKMYGPKGIGALYVKRNVKIQPITFGGSQEKGKRPGTENVPGIIGLATAFELAESVREAEGKRLVELRDKLIAGILTSIPKTRLNGHKTDRLPNNVNISFLDIEGEALLLYLDAKGIYASTGSACTSATLDPSHVILALGLPYEVAHGSMRFSLGRQTTEADIDYVLQELPPLVELLRKISPVNVDEKYFL